MKGPCKGCDTRHPGCHVECVAYKKYKFCAAILRMREKKRREDAEQKLSITVKTNGYMRS